MGREAATIELLDLGAAAEVDRWVESGDVYVGGLRHDRPGVLAVVAPTMAAARAALHGPVDLDALAARPWRFVMLARRHR